MLCDVCEHEYDPIRYRWLCPFCGFKASCCEGAPQTPVAPTAEVVPTVVNFPLGFADCVHCDEPVVRFPEGAWSHLDARDDQDHDPEPDLEPMTEREAEAQFQEWRKDMPMHSAIQINAIRDVRLRGDRL